MPLRRTPQRLVALTVAAAALFNYPFLFLAAGHGTVLGIPSLVFYVFTLWAAVIVLVGVIAERERAPPRLTRSTPHDATGTRDA